MKRILTSLLLAATVCAQATVYRAGLKGGFINSYNGDTYTTATIADIGVFTGPIAGTNRSSNVSSSTYPPVWANNRTWSFHGKMYFNGSTYYFAEGIDDAVYVAVDGTQVLKDATWNNVGVSSAMTPEAGWHDIVIRFGNGTGGAGYYNDNAPLDANGRKCGFGYAVTDTKPTSMADCTYPCDPGDGSFFRCVEEGSYITVNSIEQTANGYNFDVTMSAPSPATVTIYASETAGAADSATGWDYNSGAVSFAAGETKTLTVSGTFTTAPYFVIYLTGTGTTLAEGNGVEFWEWSEIDQCIMEPTIAAVLTGVTGTNGTFDVTLGYDKTIVGMIPPAIALKAYYGAADAGEVAADWDASLDFGSANVAGTASCGITGLTEGSVYYVRFAAKTPDSDWIWGDAMSFSTAGPSLASWPASVYENDGRTLSFAVTRPAAAAAEPLTVYLSYSANAATLVSGLPSSVEFAAGASEVAVPFTMIDNATADGDSSLVINIVRDAAYPVGNPVTATIAVVDDESLVATECVWTGGGDGETWEELANWTPRVPTIVDTAKITSLGLANNKTINVYGDAVIKDLLIETTTAFTLASQGGSFTLGGITRTDVEGTEGNHTLSVPTCLYAGSDTNCVWDIAGSGSLVINAELSKTAGTYVFKTGAGNVNMSYRDTTFSGPWIIRQGQITANVNGGNTIKGTVTIGGGDDAAKLVQSQKNSIAGKTYVHVYRNGSFESGDIDNGRVENIYVHEGGVAKVGSYFYTLNAEFWGGTYNGGTTWNSRYITSHASDTTAVFNVTWRLDGYNNYTIATERGTAPVDLLFTKAIREGGSGYNETKTGSGIVKSTVNFDALKNHFKINGGTWYVDNPGEYGLGLQETTVAAGAKLGGTGCVGMKDVKSYATLELSNGSETKYATLSPGSIDETTGELIYGTFTSGRESAHNKLTLGNWSHLDIGVGPKNPETKLSPADKLFVYGNLVIGSNCTLDVATKTAPHKKLAAGTYTIVEADSITGTFATILRPSEGWAVAYETETVDGADVVKRITLTVPPAETLIVIR